MPANPVLAFCFDASSLHEPESTPAIQLWEAFAGKHSEKEKRTN
jgi:hypothetical protein